MAYHWSAGDVRTTRQYRAATEPTPSKASFSAIPPSLIPGHRHPTFSATGTNNLNNGFLCFGPSTSNNPGGKTPATAYTPGGKALDYFSTNPSPYSFQPPPPPQLMPQSLLPQSVGPPPPPKAPFITSPTTTPTLPPKPPPFTPPPNFLPPPVLPRSQSQPPMPRGISAPSHALLPPLPPPPLQKTPPPPTPPPKPIGARSPSLAVIRSPGIQTLARPHVSLSAKPSSIVQGSKSPSAKSPVKEGMNEEQEFALALELSRQAERERANALLLAQEEDIDRAVKQSLIDAALRSGPSGSRPSTLDNENVPSSSSSIPRDVQPRSPKPLSRNVTALPVDVQLKQDEELARRLEAEYDSERPSPSSETNQRADPNPSEGPPLPRYPDIVDREPAAVNRLEPDPPASPHVPQAPLNSARSRERLSNPDLANTSPRDTPSPAQRTSPRPESQITTASQEEAESPERSPSSTQPQPPQPVVTPNQFVEQELLYGFSYGDNTPPVQNVQFRGGLPHVLALPYGKGQPMHIRASSWRQLLKLLAKLSATQIEPTVEARAATKGALRLRTVIQFFRPHPTSADWRTVIYLSIDYPPPPDHRHVNGVVNSLPYTYSLSPIPPLLRDGPDSPLSKYYTIPSTSRTPLPELPIRLDNMAGYLAEALEDSRRTRGDTPVGHRRLAKMINQFYPNQRGRVVADEEEEGGRGRGRALFGRLIGRPLKAPQGGHNADMYEVVTPFVSEWG